MSERCFPLGEGNGSEQKHSVPIYERVRGKTAVVARHVAPVRYSNKLDRNRKGQQGDVRHEERLTCPRQLLAFVCHYANIGAHCLLQVLAH